MASFPANQNPEQVIELCLAVVDHLAFDELPIPEYAETLSAIRERLFDLKRGWEEHSTAEEAESTNGTLVSLQLILAASALHEALVATAAVLLFIGSCYETTDGASRALAVIAQSQSCLIETVAQGSGSAAASHLTRSEALDFEIALAAEEFDAAGEDCNEEYGADSETMKIMAGHYSQITHHHGRTSFILSMAVQAASMLHTSAISFEGASPSMPADPTRPALLGAAIAQSSRAVDLTVHACTSFFQAAATCAQAFEELGERELSELFGQLGA